MVNPRILTFKDAYERYKKKLIVIGCCLNTQSKEVFDHEYTPDVSIVDAIMISISISIELLILS